MASKYNVIKNDADELFGFYSDILEYLKSDLAIKHRRPLYLETTFILSVLELDNMTIKK